jgi:hypothetical protein
VTWVTPAPGGGLALIAAWNRIARGHIVKKITETPIQAFALAAGTGWVNDE